MASFCRSLEQEKKYKIFLKKSSQQGIYIYIKAEIEKNMMTYLFVGVVALPRRRVGTHT